MKFGVCLPNYGLKFDEEGFLNFARRVEELGFHSVWTTDHILMPEGSGTPYERILDSITSLAAVTTVTRKVRLGISSLVMAMRNPVIVAKQLCTIDRLSGGRVVLATGAGWNEKEFRHLGADFHRRGKVLDESISIIRLMWGSKGNPFSYVGDHIPIKIERGIFSPPPVQNNLEIWIAGTSSHAMRRAAKLGDAWHPNLQPLEKFEQMVKEFRGYPGGDEKPVCIRCAYSSEFEKREYVSPQGERRIVLSKDMNQNKALLNEVERMGVSYAVLATDPFGKVDFSNQLNDLERFSSQFVD